MFTLSAVLELMSIQVSAALCQNIPTVLFSLKFIETNILKLFANWEIMHAFFCRLLIFFFKIDFFEKFFQEYHQSVSLDPNQARHFVGPNLGPTCLQKLSADNTSRLRVKNNFSIPSINIA